MDAILHIFGICADNHSHFDFLDLFMLGGSLSSIILYVRMSVNGFFKSKKKEQDI